jgi:predicted RecA/RadA family phage recombinase
MSTNLIEDGDVLQTVSTGGVVTKGMLIKRGIIRGVAKNSTTGAGGALRLDVSGKVWSLTKIAAASTNMAVGAACYGRATGSVGQLKVLGVATGGIIGYAVEAAATGDTTAKIKLHAQAIT